MKRLNNKIYFAILVAVIFFAQRSTFAGAQEEVKTLRIVHDSLADMGPERELVKVPATTPEPTSDQGGAVQQFDPYSAAFQAEAEVLHEVASHQDVKAATSRSAKAKKQKSKPQAKAAKKQAKQDAPQVAFDREGQDDEPVDNAEKPVQKKSKVAGKKPSSGQKDKGASVAVPATSGSEIESVIKKWQGEVEKNASALEAKAQEKLSQIENAISNKAEEVRQKAEEVAKKVKEEAEGSVKALITSASQEVTKLKQAIVEEEAKLKEEAARKALQEINKVEVEAMNRRIQESQELLKKHFGLPTVVVSPQAAVPTARVNEMLLSWPQPAAGLGAGLVATGSDEKMINPSPAHEQMLPAEWLNTVSREFYDGMSMMKGIILDGETQEEARMFLAMLDRKNQWFDLTLRSTKAVGDEGYKKIQHERVPLNLLIQAQRKADSMLDVVVKGAEFDDQLKKKVRLAMLYELNSLVQAQSHSLDSAARSMPVPTDEIDRLLKKVLSQTSLQFKELAAQFPDVTIKDFKTVRLQASSLTKQLRDELDALRSNFDQAQEELSSTKSKLSKAETALAKTETVVASTQKELSRAKADKVSLEKQNKDIKKAAVAAINGEIREKVNIELSLNEVEQKMTQQQKDLARALAQNYRLYKTKKSLVERSELQDKLLLEGALVQHEQQINNLMAQENSKQQFARSLEQQEQAAMATQVQLSQSQERLDATKQQVVRAAGVADGYKAMLGREQVQVEQLTSMLARTQQAVDDTKKELRSVAASSAENKERATLTEDLAQKTINSINEYLRDEKTAMAIVRHDLLSRERVQTDSTTTEQAQPAREGGQNLAAHKQALLEERALLEAVKNQTQEIALRIESSTGAQRDRLVNIQREIENKLRAIAQETANDLTMARSKAVHGVVPQRARPLKSKQLALEKAAAGHQGVSEKMPLNKTT